MPFPYTFPITFETGYFIEVDWNNDGDFIDTNDDLTINTKSIHFSRGKSDELGKADVGQLSITLNNETGLYSPSNSAGALYLSLLPKRPIKVYYSASGTNYPLFYGYIEEIIPHPHLTEQDAIITATDGLDFLSRHDMSTALYKNTLTGTIQGYILTDAGWPATMRTLDTGQDTVPYWYGADVKARFAQEEIDDSEQGFSFVDGAGYFRFEDRYHRSTATHQTSQGTFTNTMGQITYSLNPKNVYNIIKVRVTPWTLQTGVSDIGSTAIDRASYLDVGTYTMIDLANPAFEDGTITSIEVWGLASDMTGFRVGTFYWVTGTTYKCRDSEIIGAVTSGSKQTFAVSLDIKAGDFIGCHATTGNIERDNTGGSGCLLYVGESIDALDEASYILYSNMAISLYGTGISPDELWKLQEIPSIPVGETSTWWGDASVAGVSVFVDAWTTPVITTDYTANSLANGTGTDMTALIGLVATKFAKTIKLALTNNGTVPAFITLLKARGTWYDDQTKVTSKAEDSTSQTAYQKRTFELDGKYMTDTVKAQSFANYAIGKYKDPRAELGISIMNQDAATLTQILSREISDRITIVNTKLGVSADFFIDYMEHDISLSGLLHTVTYHLADCINEDFWNLGYSKLGTQTKLGY